MRAGAEQAEEEDGEAQQQEAAYLATAFELPASRCRSGLQWHGL
jgi:hypothetical protein